MSVTFQLNEDLLRQAQQVGGDLAESDRQTQPGGLFPWYTVVGKNSKDSSYRAELNGKSIEVSRAGEFRRKNEEGGCDYYDCLPSLVIVDARTANTLFQEGKVACRGLSTKGFYAPYSYGEDSVMGEGMSCDKCPFYRWNWQKAGGPEGRVLGPGGKPIAKEDLCNSSLQLFCLDLAQDEWCVVQFSAGALKHYREWARQVEVSGVKVHSLAWLLKTRQVDNGASVAPSYVPDPVAVRALTEEEFAKADAKRTELVSRAMNLSLPAVLPPSPATAALPAAAAEPELVAADGQPITDPFRDIPDL